jgi:hypothetical protein
MCEHPFVPGSVYRLYLEDGSDVGTFTTVAWDWKTGDEFWDGQHRRWRVVSVAPAVVEIYRGTLGVEPVPNR